MPKYENAVVYNLRCNNPEITAIYVGSTCNFKVCQHQHKTPPERRTVRVCLRGRTSCLVVSMNRINEQSHKQKP